MSTSTATAQAAEKKPAAKSAKPSGNGSSALVAYSPENNQVTLGSGVKRYIDNLDKLDDQQLVQSFEQMVDAERGIFVARGATAFEIFKRAEAAGQEFTKEKGQGVDALMVEISKNVGVDYGTLYSDFKAFKEFGNYLIELVEKTPEAIMPREFYVLASKVSKDAKELPYSVLQYFEERRTSTGGYYTDMARRDLKYFNEGKSVDWVLKEDMKARAAKVAGKSSTSKPAEKMISFEVKATFENIEYGRQIVKKYGSVNAWYERKCKEEFGAIEAPKAEAKPAKKKAAPKKKAAAKKPAAKKASAKKPDKQVPGTNFKK